MKKDRVKVARPVHPPLKAFGKKLRELRKARGISQQGLAVRAGATQATVAHIEAGTANPTAATLEGIATALGMELKMDLVIRNR